MENTSLQAEKLFIYELCYNNWETNYLKCIKQICRNPSYAMAICIRFDEDQDCADMEKIPLYISELIRDIFYDAIVGNRTEKEIIIIVFNEKSKLDSRGKIVEKCGALFERIALITGLKCRIGIGGNKIPNKLYSSLSEALSALNKTDFNIIHYDDLNQYIDGKPYIIEKIEQCIGHSYSKQISLETVAREVCVSPNYLSAILKEKTGKTYINYLTEIRINKAKKLLIETAFSVKTIGKQVGYSDAIYFNRVFKKQTDMTPNEFRKKCRKGL